MRTIEELHHKQQIKQYGSASQYRAKDKIEFIGSLNTDPSIQNLNTLKNYQMYNDTIGGKNLHEKASIEQAMSQRRLAYNSLEEDFAENERV